MSEKKESKPKAAQQRLEDLLARLHQLRCELRSHYESEPEQELSFPAYFEMEHCLSEATSCIGDLIGITAVRRICGSV
ncbi:MAG: hypothetical protein QM743_04710 [Chitinophagaceae bacterium]